MRIRMTPARSSVYLVETMLQRILSTLSPDTTANTLLRLDWIEALQTPGCALCHMGQHKSQRYVETLLNEAVTDVGQRDTWRAARGLCHWHAWMATETPHSAGSLAILYADVLHQDVEHLAALTTSCTNHTARACAALAGATPAELATLLAAATALPGVPPVA